MSIIKPFKALRPQPQFAKLVASKPYDVLNSAEAKIEAQGNAYSFLHITKSEIDLPEDINLYSEDVYQKAKENLQAFIQREILFEETKPCYYIYRLIMDNRSQIGLVCVSSIADYEEGLIKKHEFTRPEKEQDRINHINRTKAQTGNVFLAYRNNARIDEILEQKIKSKNPIYDFIADDQVQHTVWVINEEETVKEITKTFYYDVPCTYIADGHHRAASAAKVKDTLGTYASEQANYFLTTLFASNQLQIMDYNRVVKDLNGHSVEEIIQLIEQNFIVTQVGKDAFKPTTFHEFGMYVEGTWYKITSKPGSFTTDAIGVLDVSILQQHILEPILGIKDQRTDKRIDFVGGIRGLQELEKRVNSGEMKIAFSLYPVSIEQLFDIADSGQVMPPKSTWFEPKLRDGLLTHLI